MKKRIADDTMTDMTVKTGKSLLRTCARVCTQERFLRMICHIRHLSFVKELPRGQWTVLDTTFTKNPPAYVCAYVRRRTFLEIYCPYCPTVQIPLRNKNTAP